MAGAAQVLPRQALLMQLGASGWQGPAAGAPPAAAAPVGGLAAGMAGRQGGWGAQQQAAAWQRAALQAAHQAPLGTRAVSGAGLPSAQVSWRGATITTGGVSSDFSTATVPIDLRQLQPQPGQLWPAFDSLGVERVASGGSSEVQRAVEALRDDTDVDMWLWVALPAPLPPPAAPPPPPMAQPRPVAARRGQASARPGTALARGLLVRALGRHIHNNCEPAPSWGRVR
jgi:hypothetical protein